MKRLIILTIVSACFVSGTVIASAQTRSRVKFAAGTHLGTVKGTVRGYAYRDHIVGAEAGQTISVSLDATVMATVFTVRNPDGTNLGEGAESIGFTRDLPTSGDYVVRVMMMRAQARRKGSVSKYTLRISVK